MKYKVGDRVKAVGMYHNTPWSVSAGTLGTIQEIENENSIDVLWDSHKETWCYSIDDIYPTNDFMKHDEGKPAMDLIDSKFMLELAKVMRYGTAKYEPNNWRKCKTPSRYYAALQRHLWAYWAGEDYDPESGLHHLGHAAANVMMLMGTMTPETDDRYKEDK